MYFISKYALYTYNQIILISFIFSTDLSTNKIKFCNDIISDIYHNC